MPRLIYADALEAYLEKRLTKQPALFGWFCARIADVPTIDAEPVRHGRWVNRTIAIVDTVGSCTNCGKEAVWRSRNKPYSICPNCGAKMEEN